MAQAPISLPKLPAWEEVPEGNPAVTPTVPPVTIEIDPSMQGTGFTAPVQPPANPQPAVETVSAKEIEAVVETRVVEQSGFESETSVPDATTKPIDDKFVPQAVEFRNALGSFEVWYAHVTIAEKCLVCYTAKDSRFKYTPNPGLTISVVINGTEYQVATLGLQFDTPDGRYRIDVYPFVDDEANAENG